MIVCLGKGGMRDRWERFFKELFRWYRWRIKSIWKRIVLVGMGKKGKVRFYWGRIDSFGGVLWLSLVNGVWVKVR